jgi:hypothetical protein
MKKDLKSDREGGCGFDSSGSGKRSVADICKHGNGLLSSIKDFYKY